MRWNTPLSDEHAAGLLRELDIPDGATILDLGCGSGELLIRAVRSTSGATGVGVDSDAGALGEAARRAAAHDARVTFHEDAADHWDTPADRLICIGAAHAWGSAAPALHRLRELAKPRGRLLYGDGCWPDPPTPAAAAMFGEVLARDDLTAAARDAGWTIAHSSLADLEEWDDFEAAWCAGHERWLQTHPADDRADEVRADLAERRTEYRDTYRGVLGFAYLVLAS